ncbi:transposase [Streptomyces sp. NPDC057794]|uniref:transposase n=1 Tax=Streptomyces sp. NPDC057794 TaxID=3346251 RepID=UPI0036A7B1E9
MARTDLTDKQWAVLEPLLLRGEKPGQPHTDQEAAGGRHVVRVRTGIPCRDVLEQYGPWGRAYDLFRRRQRNGVWQRIFTQPRAAGRRQGIDHRGPQRVLHRVPGSTSTPSARRKGGLRKVPPGGVVPKPADHGLGNSRGGLTTMLLPAVEQGQEAHVHRGHTAGRRGDFPQFEAALGGPGPSAPARGRAGRASGSGGCAPTRRTPPAPSAPTCGDATSAAPSRTRPTRCAPARNAGRAAGGR